MAQMDVRAVAPVTSRRDLRHGAIDGAGLGRLRRDPDDGVLRNDPGRITPADIDIMTAPIGSVDNPIVAVLPLILPAALDDPSARQPPLCLFADGISGRRSLKRRRKQTGCE